MILDRRSGIGPHHLSIGKTRKIFDDGSKVDVFFSTGRGISHAVVRYGGEVALGESPLPTSWGGFSFTVDGGRICFVHADGKRLCVSDDLETYRTVLETDGPLAAPWLCGERWSVLERGNGVWIDGELDRSPIHHSCVQLFGPDRAVGFRGEFPTRTELCEKRTGGEWGRLAKCNVNDRTTFHFGASRSVIAYLDDGLAVSLVGRRNIIPIPCFAPNVSFINDELNVFACDYHGSIWRWREGSEVLERLPIEGPNISPLFAMTGYGTGGMLIPHEIRGDRIPILISRIEDEQTGTACLELEFAPLRMTNETMSTNPDLITRTFRRIV